MLLAAAAGLAGCGGGRLTAEQRHDTPVFLIVLDAAAARYVGTHGSTAGATPHIDDLAREAVVFDEAYSQSASTIPSTASLWTGVRVTTHGTSPRSALPRGLPILSEMLGGEGFFTFAVLGNPNAGDPALGFDRGWDAYRLVYATADPGTNGEYRYRIVTPRDVNAQVFELLQQVEGPRVFGYVHYLQPHRPYEPPEPYLGEFLERIPGGGEPGTWAEWGPRFDAANRTGSASAETIANLEARYLGNLKYADAAVGRLFDELRERRLYDASLIVLTADHGEAFFGHGRFGHNAHLYDDMTRIPLIIKFPRAARVGSRRIASPVETVDLLPTLLDYLGLPIPEHVEGDSLWPLIRGTATGIAHSEVVMSTLFRETHALRAGPYKFILHAAGDGELYDLRDDPRERHDLAAERPDVAAALRASLESYIDVGAGRTRPDAARPEIEPGLRELLESLGYVGP